MRPLNGNRTPLPSSQSSVDRLPAIETPRRRRTDWPDKARLTTATIAVIRILTGRGLGVGQAGGSQAQRHDDRKSGEQH